MSSTKKRTPLRKLPQPRVYECVVYFIAAGDDHIKVGNAIDANRRLKELQTGNPVKLELIGSIGCVSKFAAEELESAIQRYYGSVRAEGEWFRITRREAAAHIAVLKTFYRTCVINESPVKSELDIVTAARDRFRRGLVRAWHILNRIYPVETIERRLANGAILADYMEARKVISTTLDTNEEIA